MITLEELKKMNTAKLAEELNAAKKELFKITFDVKTGQSKNTHKIKNYRKYIAQIETLIQETNINQPS